MDAVKEANKIIAEVEGTEVIRYLKVTEKTIEGVTILESLDITLDTLEIMKEHENMFKILGKQSEKKIKSKLKWHRRIMRWANVHIHKNTKRNNRG